MQLRRTGLLALAAVVVVAGVATLAAAHGTHATVRPQVVADGEVVVDSVATTEDGFLVVHRDAGGEPGEAIGHVDLETGIHEDLRVRLDASLPSEAVTLWAVVHDDDGDGTFEPGSDPPVRSFGGVAGDTFVARTGERPVFVTSLDTEAQGANETVGISGVGVDREAFLVVHRDDRGQPGAVVGNVSLSPGVYRDVRVPVDPDIYPERRGFVQLWAVVYADDGDGTFDPASDEVVTVGQLPVRTQFTVREVDRSAVDRATPTTTATATGSSGDDGGNGDGTEGGDGADGETTDDGPAGVAIPGFGIVLAIVTIALAVAALARRRSQ